MNSGMFAAVSGNLAAMRRMDMISNNLANVNTAGFKKDKMSFEGLLASSTTPPSVPQGTTADPIMQKENMYIDYSAGPVSQTGNTLDLALDGDGFFAVNTPNGVAYTRQGSFRMSADGTLVTADGYPVQAQGGGEIHLKGSRIEITANGAITVDGSVAGNLSVVDFEKPYSMEKKGNTLMVPTDPQAQTKTSTAQVRQGHLEGSNVETMYEMAQMIETNRYFEACQKVIRGYDDVAAKAVNDLGRL